MRQLDARRGPHPILRLYIALSGMKDVGTSLSDLKKSIGDFQHQQKRSADIAIDLFVGLCTVSRADALDKAKDAHAAEAIAEVFTKQARRRMSRNVRGVEHNEDGEIEKLATFITERGAYPWDVI